MVEKIKIKRKKPSFLRSDSHKMIKLGKGVKKNKKWRGAKGRQNKIRLCRKGYGSRPKIGYGEDNELKGKVNGVDVVRIENIKELSFVGKGHDILIASVGKKKREEISKVAKSKGMKIINKYKERVK